jgi:hypothetical protein
MPTKGTLCHARICGQCVEFRLGDVHREHRRNVKSQQAALKSGTGRRICGAAEMRRDDRVLNRANLRPDGREGGGRVPRRLIGERRPCELYDNSDVPLLLGGGSDRRCILSLLSKLRRA